MAKLTTKQRALVKNAKASLKLGDIAAVEAWLDKLLAEPLPPSKPNRCVVCDQSLSGTIVVRTEPDPIKARSDARYAHRRCAKNAGLQTYSLREAGL